MNINVPDLVKAAVPEGEGRNVQIISQNGSDSRDPGFLSSNFPRSSPKLYLTSESDDFDEITLAEWQDEGFDVEFLSMGNGGDEYLGKLRALGKKGMGPGEKFGIVGK